MHVNISRSKNVGKRLRTTDNPAYNVTPDCAGSPAYLEIRGELHDNIYSEIPNNDCSMKYSTEENTNDNNHIQRNVTEETVGNEDEKSYNYAYKESIEKSKPEGCELPCPTDSMTEENLNQDTGKSPYNYAYDHRAPSQRCGNHHNPAHRCNLPSHKCDSPSQIGDAKLEKTSVKNNEWGINRDTLHDSYAIAMSQPTQTGTPEYDAGEERPRNEPERHNYSYAYDHHRPTQRGRGIQRGVTPLDDNQGYEVPLENQGYEIPVDNQGYEVPVDNQGYEIQSGMKTVYTESHL